MTVVEQGDHQSATAPLNQGARSLSGIAVRSFIDSREAPHLLHSVYVLPSESHPGFKMNRRLAITRLLTLSCSSALFSGGCNPSVSDRARPSPANVQSGSHQFDPQVAVADLLTERREQAFKDLQSWWKSHQPEVDRSYYAKIRKVERYQGPNDSPITVVFTGTPGSQIGEIYLINSDGRQTKILQGHGVTDGDDVIVDVNGDKLPEIVAVNDFAAAHEYKIGKPERVVTVAKGLTIIPITPEQIPLLQVIFDVRPFKATPTWRWSFVEKSGGVSDVLIEQQQQGEWTERARFVWSELKSQFEGPAGSESEGFIANAGNLDKEQIEQFFKKLSSK